MAARPVDDLEVRVIDVEIVRLHGQARRAADLFDRELARLKIDELLERRFELVLLRSSMGAQS